MKITIKRKAILITVIICLLSALVIAGTFLLSSNYQTVYNTPKNIDGVMDFEGYNISENSMDAVMSGKWEFFYNKWIVTDNEPQAKADGMIKIPSRWTGKKIDGKPLPKTGYASYRLNIVNISEETTVLVSCRNAAVAYRTYINGELNVVSGVVSKDIKETFVSSRFNEAYRYKVSPGDSLSIVIEISANSDGGMFASPWFFVSREYSALGSFVGFIAYLMLGITLAFVAFSFIINLGVYRKEKQISSSFLLLAVLSHLLTSKEVFSRFKSTFPNINYMSVYHLNFLTAVLLMTVFISHLMLSKVLKMKKTETVIFTAVNLICITAYYLLRGTSFQIIPIAVSMLGFAYILYLLVSSALNKIKYSRIYILMLITLAGILTIEISDNLGLIVYGIDAVFSVILLFIMLLLSIISFIKIRDSADGALRAAHMELDLNKIKHKALRSQVKPHFIFNSLSAIQSLYRKDSAAADEALTKFATHLRQNIDADNNDFISFDKEIKNIMNYVELENLRLDKKLTLLLDINYSDFQIPVLSLQPLIENAIKYAKTEEMPDGYILLSSKHTKSETIVKVADNGKGFDINNIRENATGLKNTRERLSYLLGAQMTVISQIGAGTTITIKIPCNSGTDEKIMTLK